MIEPVIGNNAQIDETCKIGIDGDEGIRIGDNVILRSNTVLYSNNHIGHDFVTGHNVVIRNKNTIGNRVTVGSNSTIEGHCTIEDDATIHSNCYVGEQTVIKKNAWLGPGVITVNTKYPKHKERIWESPVIGEHTVVGAGTIILPGVTIGAHCMIGAGSVVSRDIPDGKVAVGQPAIVTKDVGDIRIKGEAYER